jgi:UDP-2-acetamido-2,6-beta-L-arabino-hexul-4-ose reductase
MVKVGITGQAGFIGTHLSNFLGLYPDKIVLVPFEDAFFNDNVRLTKWTEQCDTIVHLAAVNRHSDQETLFNTNILLVTKLIEALDSAGNRPHVIFSSSSQESRDNDYGKSKREGRKMLTDWALRNNAIFTGLIVPNVFGPFGLPFYNSVVATFCYQLTHSVEPAIDVDGGLNLIYVVELAEEILRLILSRKFDEEYVVLPTAEKKVSELIILLKHFKAEYFDKGLMLSFKDKFELNLFNTFRSFIDYQNKFPVYFDKKTDNRGFFVELVRTLSGSQMSFSTTNPGIIRGNHYHTRKIERFAVIRGSALIQMRRIGTSEILNFNLSGDNPSYVDIPVWYTHNIKNTGSEELMTIFWINEFYNEDDPDTFYESV